MYKDDSHVSNFLTYISKTLSFALVLLSLACTTGSDVSLNKSSGGDETEDEGGNTNPSQSAQITFSSFTVTEGDNTVVVFLLSDPLEGNANFDWEITGTNVGSEFTVSSGSVTILAGETSKNIQFTSIENDTYENDRSFDLDISNLSNNLNANVSSVSFDVLDDESIPQISFDSSSANFNEASGTYNLDFTLSEKSSSNSVFALGTAGTSNGSDHDFSATSISIPAGSTSATIPIAITNDGVVEGDETLIITLSSVTSGLGVIGTPNSTTITIVDDDALPGDPSIALSDGTTSSTSYVRQVATAISITNDTNAVKWCVSESQSTAPATGSSTCTDGQGGSAGWHTSRPTTFNLTSAQGGKTVYLWTADGADNVSANAGMDTIILDSVLPATPTVSADDFITGSTTITYTALADLVISGDTDALTWCLIQQDNVSGAPVKPLFNDGCFTSPKPSNVTLIAGDRILYLYTKDIAGNVSSTFGSHAINYTVNTPPTAVDDTAPSSVYEASTINLDVLANDSDGNGDAIGIDSVTQGSKGSVTVEVDDTITYTPNSNSWSTDTFTYTISDGRGGTDTATVTVHIYNDFTWTGGGGDANWSTGSNWYSGSPPALDTSSTANVAVFDGSCSSNCTPVQDGPIQVYALEFLEGWNGTFTQADSISIGSAGLLVSTGTFTGSADAFSTVDIDVHWTGTFNMPSIVAMTGDFYVEGPATFNHNNSTITFSSSAISSYLNFNGHSLYNVTFSKSSTRDISIQSTLVIDNDLSVAQNSDSNTIGGAGTIDLKGDLIVTGGGECSTTLDFSSGGTQNINQTDPSGICNTIISSGTSLNYLTDVYFSGNITVDSGTISHNNFNTIFNGSSRNSYLADNTGTAEFYNLILNKGSTRDLYLTTDINVKNDLTFNMAGASTTTVGPGNFNLEGNLIIDDTFNPTVHVKLMGTGAQSITKNNLGLNGPGIIIDKPSGTASFATDYNFITDFRVLNSSSVNIGSSNFKFRGSHNSNIEAPGISLNDIEFSKDGNDDVVVVGIMDIDGDLNINHVDTVGCELIGNVELAGDLYLNEGSTGGTGTITFNSGGTQTFFSPSIEQTPNIAIAAGTTLVLNDEVRFTRNFTAAAGSNFNQNGNRVRFGYWNSVIDASTIAFDDVLFSSASGTNDDVSIVGSMDIDGNLEINHGDTSGSNLLNGTIYLSGDLIATETSSIGTTLIVFDGASGDQNITATSVNEMINNIEINKASGNVVMQSDLRVDDIPTETSGILDFNGFLISIHSNGAYTFNWPRTFDHLELRNDSNADVNLAHDITVLGDFYVRHVDSTNPEINNNNIFVGGDMHVIQGSYGGTTNVVFNGGINQNFFWTAGTNLQANWTVTNNSTLILQNDLTINDPANNLTVDAGSTIDINGQILTIGNNFNSNGNFIDTPATGSFSVGGLCSGDCTP